MGTTFFVTHAGTLEVSVNGNVVNTLMEGQAFGGPFRERVIMRWH